MERKRSTDLTFVLTFSPVVPFMCLSLTTCFNWKVLNIFRATFRVFRDVTWHRAISLEAKGVNALYTHCALHFAREPLPLVRFNYLDHAFAAIRSYARVESTKGSR